MIIIEPYLKIPGLLENGRLVNDVRRGKAVREASPEVSVGMKCW